MQVLGNLIELSEDGALPLPWWHRAPLGLMHRTPVFVALVHTQSRPVGDLILSVLDPNQWDRMLQLRAEEDDRPGVVARIFEALSPLNIALAETVTVARGDKHNVTIIGEPVLDQIVPRETIEKNLRQTGLETFTLEPFLRRMPRIRWQAVGEVDHGWLREADWEAAIRLKYPDSCQDVDLRRAVVSADTDRRILRYVFPRNGAVTVRIKHTDRPGVLRQLADAIAKCELNILSGLLRRGGTQHHMATFVAVCEPLNSNSPGATEDRLSKALDELTHELRVEAKIFRGDKGEERIYPRHPEELVARVPKELRPVLQDLKARVPDTLMPVFLSRRFLSGERREKVVERVRKVLRESDCMPIEAVPRSGNLATTLIQVSSRMWLSEAGIVLVSGERSDAFSMNLAYEAGFLQGQGKPVLVLVEQGSGEGMKEWSNAHGLVAPRFASGDQAFNPEDPESIDAKVKEWLRNLRGKDLA